jgi:hypothetical protein
MPRGPERRSYRRQKACRFHQVPKNRLDPAQTSTRMIAVTTRSRVTSDVLLFNLGGLVGTADLMGGMGSSGMITPRGRSTTVTPITDA